MQRPFFTIIGGMGPLASENLVYKLNRCLNGHSDQDYFDYVLFNDAGAPDRTAYILNPESPSPIPTLLDNIKKSQMLGASFIVISCNTAHHFYDQLQAQTEIPILHMPKLALAWAAKHFPANKYPRLGFLGSEGAVKSEIYKNPTCSYGYRYLTPTASIQNAINSLIYRDVKGGRGYCEERFLAPIKQMLDQDRETACDAVILGCTELSVLNESFQPDLPIIDPQTILVAEIRRRCQLDKTR